MSNYYITAFTLLGVHGLLTVGLPRFGGSIAFVSRYPRAAITVWLVGLAVASTSLTTAFGMLIANSLSESTTLGIGEAWQVSVVQYALGWISLAGLGVIVFHLGAAAQWLRTERTEYAAHVMGVIKSSGPSHLGDDVREVDVDRHLISAFPQTGTILVSRYSVESLSQAEMHAALTHERAHLAGHHALVVSLAQLAIAAAAGVDASKRFARTVQLAIEFAADDIAVKVHGHEPLARAIRATSGPNDSLAEFRLQRLSS